MGTLNHDMKATYQRYFGWWDGNPATSSTRCRLEESASKYVALAGGPDKLAAGKDFAIAKDNAGAAEMLEQAFVFAAPDTRRRAALASAYDQLGYQAESGAWRNWSHLAAGRCAAMRSLAAPVPARAGRSSTRRSRPRLRPLATRFDAVKGVGQKGVFQFVMPDEGESVAVVVEGGLNSRAWRRTPRRPRRSRSIAARSTM